MGPDVVSTFIAIVNRLNLTNAAAAGVAGIAPNTVGEIRATGKAPKHTHCRNAVTNFVSLNRRAKSRGELRVVP